MPVGRALDRQVGQPNDRVSKSQPLNNPARHAVRFWAYDNAIEASFFDQHVGGWVRGMPSCDALHQDGWKLGRPHEVDRLEWVWQPLPAPKSSFVHNQGGPLMEEFIHQRNLALFKKLLAEPHTDAEREVLLKLLADEEANEPRPKMGNLQPIDLVEEETRVVTFGSGFQSDEVKLMSAVLDEAMIILPEAERTSPNKSKLASRILAAAAKGERDPNKLRIAALLVEMDV
jgi:hypothetical protein